MQYTTNYNLKKPGASDTVDIDDLNDNADTIDTQLKALDTSKQDNLTAGVDYVVPEAGKGLFSGSYTDLTNKPTIPVPPLTFTSQTCSSWQSDATYSDFAYRGSIPLSGVTASDMAEVVFGVTEALSGDYAPVCQTYDGGVYIYGSANSTITIQAILVHKG